MVGRDAVKAAVERDEDLGGEPRCEGYGEAEDQLIPIACIRSARESEKRDAADKCCEDRHPDNPRGELSLGGSEGLGAAAAAAIEAATKECYASDEEEEDDII